jgi:hypothetical protein
MKYRVIKRKITKEVAGVICDKTIVLTGATTSNKFPERLRRIGLFDADTRVIPNFSLITSNYLLSQSLFYIGIALVLRYYLN